MQLSLPPFVHLGRPPSPCNISPHSMPCKKKRSYVGCFASTKNTQNVSPSLEAKVERVLDNVKWDNQGLAVAIAQDIDTGSILMQGFANREALASTISSKKATFFSRSRSKLWIKGETSMNFINIFDVFLDCDSDSLIYLGKAEGPTCHTGSDSCYYSSVFDSLYGHGGVEYRPLLSTLYALELTIKERQEESNKIGKPSWTKNLLNDSQLLCSKIREEADELCMTMEKNENADRTESEMADVLYHAMVLLAARGVDFERVLCVLRKRMSQSGLQEKMSRLKPT